MAGSDFGLSMRLEGFPVCAPLARSFVATGAVHVIDRPYTADEQREQFAQHRFVICAAYAGRTCIQCDGARHFEQHIATDAPHFSGGVPRGDAPRPPQGNRPSDERRQHAQEPSRDGVDRLVRCTRDVAPRSAKHGFGVRPAADESRERHRFVVRRALSFSHGVGVAFDLEIDGITEAEPFVAQLIDEFVVEIARRIYIAHRFEKAQWEQRVYCRKHSSKSDQLCCRFPDGYRSRVIDLARLSIGAAAAAVIGVAAHRARALSLSGALGAAVIGAAAVGAGWSWGIFLVAYFVSASTLSRFRAGDRAKRVAGLIEKDGPRDVRQVAANGGVFALCAIGSMLSMDPLWQALAAAALGASAADTWATEIGTLARAAPRSIVDWSPVPAGTSGGVTVQGTLAAIAGAAFTAGVAWLVRWPVTAVVAAFIGGVGGCLVDSW